MTLIFLACFFFKMYKIFFYSIARGCTRILGKLFHLPEQIYHILDMIYLCVKFHLNPFSRLHKLLHL